MLYNVVLVSATHQYASAMDIYVSLLPPTSLESPSHLSLHTTPQGYQGYHRAPGLRSLHHTAHSQELSVLHMVMCMCQCHFLNSSHPLLPLLCPQAKSLHLYLYSFPANMSIITISLDSIYINKCLCVCISIYALVYDICFSLSDLLHCV